MDLLQQQLARMFPFIACLFLGQYVVSANPGTQFIVGFMENVEAKYPPLLVIGGNPHTSSNVTVTCPGLNFSRSFEVLKLQAARVELPKEALNVGSFHNVNGILVEASADVTVNGFNTASANSMDGFTALPTKDLGLEYRVISTNVSEQLPTDQRWSEFLVIGVFDDTTVEVQPIAPAYYRNVSYATGETIKIQISRLETVQLQSQRDLTGTRVTSDRPVAVMSGSKCANVPVDVAACDHLVEFVPPTNRWGREFILPTFLARMAGDYFKLVGFEPETNVTIVAPSVGNHTLTLGEGEHHTFELHSLESGYVTSTRPIMAAQYSQGAFADDGVGGDPSMLLVTSTDQWKQGSSAHVTFSTYDVTADGLKAIQSYITVTSRCSFSEDVVVDGRSLPVPKELVAMHGYQGEDANVCVMRSQLGPGIHTVSTLKADVAFAAYVYGFGEHIAYAYPLGSGEQRTETPTPSVTTYEPNQQHSTGCSRASIALWAVTCISIIAVCVLTGCSLALRRKLKAFTLVQPLHSHKPRPVHL